MTNPTDEISQKERRDVLRNDRLVPNTYFSQAQGMDFEMGADFPRLLGPQSPALVLCRIPSFQKVVHGGVIQCHQKLRWVTRLMRWSLSVRSMNAIRHLRHRRGELDGDDFDRQRHVEMEKSVRPHCQTWPHCWCYSTLELWARNLEAIWKPDELEWAECTIFIRLACISAH